jgi:hypothetical protein
MSFSVPPKNWTEEDVMSNMRSSRTTMFSARLETPLYDALKKLSDKTRKPMAEHVNAILRAMLTTAAKTAKAKR